MSEFDGEITRNIKRAQQRKHDIAPDDRLIRETVVEVVLPVVAEVLFDVGGSVRAELQTDPFAARIRRGNLQITVTVAIDRGQPRCRVTTLAAGSAEQDLCELPAGKLGRAALVRLLSQLLATADDASPGPTEAAA